MPSFSPASINPSMRCFGVLSDVPFLVQVGKYLKRFKSDFFDKHPNRYYPFKKVVILRRQVSVRSDITSPTLISKSALACLRLELSAFSTFLSKEARIASV